VAARGADRRHADEERAAFRWSPVSAPPREVEAALSEGRLSEVEVGKERAGVSRSSGASRDDNTDTF